MSGIPRYCMGRRWRLAGAAGRIGVLLYVALLTVLAAAVYHGLKGLQAG